MAFQFAHAKTYSIKTGGVGIAAEAGRKPDHSRHVENPKPPVLLLGVEPEAAWQEIERRHGAARNTVQTKKGPVERRLRKDENVLLAAVASYPVPTEKLDPDDPDFQRWQEKTLEFFRKVHGKALSAVLHLDEAHPHIHYLTAPDLEKGERMADIHPGERAKRDAGGRKGKRTEKNHLYKEAMRKYQDDFHKEVSVYFGHARLGPQRERLSRGEWKAKEAENKRVAQQIRQLEKRDVELKEKALEMDKQGSALRAQITRHSSRVAADKEKLKTELEKHKKIVSLIEKREKKLSDKEKNISKREQKAEEIIRENSSFYGRALSVVTLGSKGVEKEVREARKAAKEEAQREIEVTREKLEKARRVALTRKRKIENLESDIKEKSNALKQKESEIQDLKNAVEGMQESLSQERKKMMPLQGEVAIYQKNNRILSVKLDSLKESLEALDIDQAKKITSEIELQIKGGGGGGGTEIPKDEKFKKEFPEWNQNPEINKSF